MIATVKKIFNNEEKRVENLESAIQRHTQYAHEMRNAATLAQNQIIDLRARRMDGEKIDAQTIGRLEDQRIESEQEALAAEQLVASKSTELSAAQLRLKNKRIDGLKADLATLDSEEQKLNAEIKKAFLNLYVLLSRAGYKHLSYRKDQTSIDFLNYLKGILEFPSRHLYGSEVHLYKRIEICPEDLDADYHAANQEFQKFRERKLSLQSQIQDLEKGLN